MKNSLLICDDEVDMREGLKLLLDWESLGVEIIGTASDGREALDKISKENPDICLMDIRMPKLTGLDVIHMAHDSGNQTRFIITSAYSDFSYAKEAMKYGVSHYLTKPIDEDELTAAIKEIQAEIEIEHSAEENRRANKERLQETILKDLLKGTNTPNNIDWDFYGLNSPVYQVVLYTPYKRAKAAYENENEDYVLVSAAEPQEFDFADMLRIANKDNSSFDSVRVDDENIILLKSPRAVEKFQDLIDRHMVNPQKGSALYSLFLVFGRPIYEKEAIHLSYEDVVALMKRRYFQGKEQHVLSYHELSKRMINEDSSKNDYARKFASLIETGSKEQLCSAIREMSDDFSSNAKYVNNLPLLKITLGNILVETKHLTEKALAGHEVNFASDDEIIKMVNDSDYLYDVIERAEDSFLAVIDESGQNNGSNIIDSVSAYMRSNLSEQLTLGDIALLFHYNRSYLGKLFLKTTGKNFNQYLDDLRIEKAKEMLKESDLKIYEISGRLGYSSVDYFHKKFKRATGTSPQEFRKNVITNS